MSEHGWMVRAGRNSEHLDSFLDRSFVAVGWLEMGDLSEVESRDAIKERYSEIFPERKIERLRAHAGILFRFAHEIDSGDAVITYDDSARVYHVGTVTGSYGFKPDDELSSYPHRRSIDWTDSFSRDVLSDSTKNALGGPLTVFSIDGCLTEIKNVVSTDDPSEPPIKDDPVPYIEEVESKAHELISDLITSMDPFDFEELVAAVLRAMGYAAETTQSGADFGVDIEAYPDQLGFENPVIKVQVKRVSAKTGNEDIGRFLGTIDPDEKGLFVSTGGYTRPANREARAAVRRVTLLDRDGFIRLLLEHYNELEQEYKAQIPLKQVYVPADISGISHIE